MHGGWVAQCAGPVAQSVSVQLFILLSEQKIPASEKKYMDSIMDIVHGSGAYCRWKNLENGHVPEIL